MKKIEYTENLNSKIFLNIPKNGILSKPKIPETLNCLDICDQIIKEINDLEVEDKDLFLIKDFINKNIIKFKTLLATVTGEVLKDFFKNIGVNIGHSEDIFKNGEVIFWIEIPYDNFKFQKNLNTSDFIVDCVGIWNLIIHMFNYMRLNKDIDFIAKYHHILSPLLARIYRMNFNKLVKNTGMHFDNSQYFMLSRELKKGK